MPDDPDVRPGQIWADNDPRMVGRTLQVKSVHLGNATCEVLTNADWVQAELDRAVLPPAVKDSRGRTTRIRVARFTDTRTGYRLIRDAPGRVLRDVELQSYGPDLTGMGKIVDTGLEEV